MIALGIAALGLGWLCGAGVVVGRGAPLAHAIDHVGIGVSDLDRGIAALARTTGVTAVAGGSHPGRGTHNALLSLGHGTYLEILAPLAGAALDPELAGLAKLEAPTPVLWAVRSTDLDATARRLKESGFAVGEIRAGSRARPDGSLLKWRTLGLSGPGLEAAPFFIEWDKSSPHPSQTSPAGCTLARLEVFDPDASGLTRLQKALALEVVVGTAASPGLRLTLACPKGEVVLGTSQ